jgi:uncharacterized protein (DUF1015 family)
VAEIKPFRALRYDERRAGPLEQLVAPPYDVIGADEREEYRSRSPHNVVHLTLPDSEAEAGRLFRRWRDEGVLVADEPGFWALSQDYEGPDGVARTRSGLVASLTVEPYETGSVLPHERTHRGPKEGRLRLVREVGAQLEPIFLLYEGPPPFEMPAGSSDVAVEGTSLWRLPGADQIGDAFRDRQLLIADGHHRYETALAFHEETGTPESGSMLVVLVSLEDPGLTIFATHRVFRGEPELGLGGEPRDRPDEALAELNELSRERAAVVVYDGERTELAVDGDGELDVTLVDRLGHEGISYTPSWQEAVHAVDSGEAAVAVLMRPTRIEDVFAVAKRGETMPQKSTYFYPKLLSGLLLHPLEG